MFNKKKRIQKIVDDLRATMKKEDNYGLLYKKLNSLKYVIGGKIYRAGYVFTDITMDDGYTVSTSECFEVDSLKSAMKKVADRLEERFLKES